MIDNNDSTPCEMQLFKAPDALPMRCLIDKFPLVKNIYHRFLNKKTCVHVRDDTLTISCTDLPESFVKEVNVLGGNNYSRHKLSSIHTRRSVDPYRRYFEYKL